MFHNKLDCVNDHESECAVAQESKRLTNMLNCRNVGSFRLLLSFTRLIELLEEKQTFFNSITGRKLAFNGYFNLV